MRYNDRKDWQYDPEVFAKKDVQTALKINAEYICRHSPKPYPCFMEVDRTTDRIDPLWHIPLDSNGRTPIRRSISIPAINQFSKNRAALTPTGLVNFRADQFILSNLTLASPEIDYFPERGDFVFWNGFRRVILNIELTENGYWQQTNVWLSLIVECIISPEGDAKPFQDLSKVNPIEASSAGPIAYKLTHTQRSWP